MFRCSNKKLCGAGCEGISVSALSIYRENNHSDVVIINVCIKRNKEACHKDTDHQGPGKIRQAHSVFSVQF